MLLLLVEMASLERLTALQDHRLEPLALAVAQLSWSPEREVQRTASSAARLERNGDPPRRARFAQARERGHLVGRERPDGLAGRDRAGEGNVVVQACRSPGGQLVVVVPRARDDLDELRTTRPREHDEAGFRSDGGERVLEAGVAHVERGRRLRERRGDLLQPSRRVGAGRDLGLGAAALELLEREPGLVGVASDDGERRRVGLGDDRLP